MHTIDHRSLTQSMLSICLLDDKSYGISQIRNALDGVVSAYEFRHADRVQRAVSRHWDLLFLDYWLDLDGLTGADVIGDIDADIIIAFSSVPERNDELLQLGAHFAATKRSKTERNFELEHIIHVLFETVSQKHIVSINKN